MDLFGAIISASLLPLLLPIVRSDISGYTCTTLADLAQPCGCQLSKESFDPVCGSDGKSYFSLCFLKCRQSLDGTNIRVVKNDVCAKDLLCTCNAGYSPVCGSNGVTYSNECVLNCNVKKDSSLYLKHRGKCEDESNEDTTIWLSSLRLKCSCNPTNVPICGSDGITYANHCVLQCKAKIDPSVVFHHWGACREPYKLMSAGKERYCTSLSDLSEPCGCILSKETFDPVCADDKKSYLNSCFLKCQQTLDDTTFKVVKKGACSKDSHCACNSVYKPVCGSNGVTYTNECVLNCQREKFPSLSLVYRRKCEDGPDLSSPEKNDAPKKCCYHSCDCCETQAHINTCANGQWPTHRPCEFKCDAYENKITTTKKRKPCHVTQQATQERRPFKDQEVLESIPPNICYCAAVNHPICGTNDKTYANICVLHCNTKKNTSIEFKRWGPCGNTRVRSKMMSLLLTQDDTLLRNQHFDNLSILIPFYRDGRVLVTLLTVTS